MDEAEGAKQQDEWIVEAVGVIIPLQFLDTVIMIPSIFRHSYNDSFNF